MTQTLREKLQDDFEQFPYRARVNVTLFLYKAHDSDELIRKIHTVIPLPMSEEYINSFEVTKVSYDFATYEKSLAAMAAEIVEMWDTDILTRLGWQPDLIESLRKKHVLFPHCSVFAQINKIVAWKKYPGEIVTAK